ncbi:pantoate--beta-alanine ligase [Pelagibacteraceae bacterium]|nr:pantoate--beta-alanine ligase [Pelagibacteraceae bacterium]
MKIILNKNELKKSLQNEKNLGFVPTMGAVHFGHISLIKKSIKQCNKTLVSIFVNKPQFNKKSDFNKYPRTIHEDVSVLKKLRVDFLYLPKFKDIYPRGINKKIKINSFSKKLCGKFRPRHFEAIVDVIDRFIKIIFPKKIYFGEKDMQQLKIVEDYIKKNHKFTNVVKCKTIREKNGIAYSSRNQLLNEHEKKIASKIYKLISVKKKRSYKKKNTQKSYYKKNYRYWS